MAIHQAYERHKVMRKSRALSFILLAGLSVSTLTACGGSGVKNLAATCESLRKNLSDFVTNASIGRELYYDGDSVAMLLGDVTRQNNKEFIYENFPFMKDYSITSIQSGEYQKGVNDSQIQAAVHVFESTPNPIVLTDKDSELIESSDDPYTEIIEPKVLRVIGDAYSDEGCAGLDATNGLDDDFLSDERRTVPALYENMLEAAEDSVGHLLGILLCERDGKIDDEKCDTEDFELTYTDPSTLPPTPEELEILDERRQEAEREAQNPSTPSYSNVSPLQLCSSAGVVVQTENYGQLTCGFMWVNRVRTLVWMRS
jgi:hypothetical protein